MKTTGIIRRVDDLGRVVIPREIRRSLDIKEGDPLEIIVADEMVCFMKYYAGDFCKQKIKSLIEYINDEDEFKNKREITAKLQEALELLTEKGED